ncbi:MAG: response regulator transcription factor [Bacteroidota bacterium]
MKRNINILLVDDHKMIRDAIRTYLDKVNEFQVVAEAESGEQALIMMDRKPADVVFMDLNMGGMGGIETTTTLIRNHPETKVIALTMLDEHQHIREMFKAGATGYLLKNSEEEEIIEAVYKVMMGEMYYSAEVQKVVMQSLFQPNPPGNRFNSGEMPLTERELEVLQLIVREFSNREIAEQLFISVRTVDAHRRSLMEKTGAKNTAGLVMYAVRKNLV